MKRGDMEQRIIGIETEFGCMIRSSGAGTAERVVEAVKDHAFYKQRLGTIDLHARDYAFEPARSGGFLLNGGRLYIDAVGDHEEYATPECTRFLDVVAYHKAGLLLLQSILDDLDLTDKVSFHNNSVDHFGGHTFGCHENYLVDLEHYYWRESLALLLPFLVTRQIYAGVGRVGGHKLNYNDFRNNIMDVGDHEVDYVWVSNFYGVEIDKSVDFQLSQRADHIVNAVSSRVRFNRAIINPKQDSYYNFSNRQRLHILYGEANMCEYATFLKVGTTSLVLDLIEMGCLPREVEIAEPVHNLKAISRDSSWRWPVRRKDGTTIGAVDLQRIYLKYAKEYLTGKDEQTDRVLVEWENTLNLLESDPMALADRLDWVAKRKLYEEYIESEGVSWQDDILQSLDLEYHNINPRDSLYFGLEEMEAVQRIVPEETLQAAVRTPPDNTRARGRSYVIQKLLESKSRRYVVDWDFVYVDEKRQLPLKDPFETYQEEAARFARSL
ncbi:MAG: proteasome accessory factor PafA2 family protein [Armatimonadetes bacterium]|nr:proteasome accessory factor PafA2 family protein [Armatimonadota bacterium]